ncbi:MAG: DUF4176 domain-containing protein [Lachnospiraceae bacterium]|nr:DUF4176 domain-containing protein [Lachnospiraceae bacterium]
MLKGLLPVGTVVLLKNSEKRVMIIGVLQKQLKEGEEVIWDYAGCLYPEGYLGPDKTYLFNESQIEKIFALGYQDDEQFEFKEKIDEIRNELLANNQG